LRFEGSDILYNRLNMQFLKYWNIINNSVRVSKREEGKKRIGTTEDTKYLKFRVKRGMSNWLVRQRIIPSIIQ